MLSSTDESEVVCFKKMFVWKLNISDQDSFLKLAENGLFSHKMTSIDPYNGKKYTGTFKLEKNSAYSGRPSRGFFSRGGFGTRINSHSFSIDINPNPDLVKYFYINDNRSDIEGNSLTLDNGCKKLCFYVDVTIVRQYSSPLPQMKSVSEKLKQLWKDDPSVKFTIKCKGNTIETSKPFMAASSSVFKAMFDRDWKESSENSIEIVDFDPDVVRKMVEFCENGTITDVEEFEELYKIADKYDIQELMKLTLVKFDQTMTVENVHTRLQMAEQYELKDLRKRCRVFCALNDVDF